MEELFSFSVFFEGKPFRALSLREALEITPWEASLSDTYHLQRKWSIRQAAWHPEKLREGSMARGTRECRGLAWEPHVSQMEAVRARGWLPEDDQGSDSGSATSCNVALGKVGTRWALYDLVFKKV